jgi:hypothetical protein
MAASRAEEEIRAIVMMWRHAIRDVRAGHTPASRESVYRATVRALDQLEAVQRVYHVFPVGDQTNSVVQRLTAARAEVQGALLHDLADSRESVG